MTKDETEHSVITEFCTRLDRLCIPNHVRVTEGREMRSHFERVPRRVVCVSRCDKERAMSAAKRLSDETDRYSVLLDKSFEMPETLFSLSRMQRAGEMVFRIEDRRKTR